MTEKEALKIINSNGMKVVKLNESRSDKRVLRDLEDIIELLPFFSRVLGESPETLKNKGFGFGFGVGSAEEQDKIGAAIFDGLEDYVSWKTVKASDGNYYLDIDFKPELWTGSYGLIEDIFTTLDRRFRKYGA